MFRTLVETICGSAVEDEGMPAPRGLARAELQDLFREDFAAQSVMIRSRKPMRAAKVQMAA